MMHYACKKCGSKNVGIETKGTQIGLYCLDCGAWIKWCNKDEVRLFSNRQHNQDNTFSENIKKIAEHYGLDSQTQWNIEEDRLTKTISDVAYILDSLILLRQIQQTGDCNICKNRDCGYMPKIGQTVRYNCPFYKAESEDKE